MTDREQKALNAILSAKNCRDICPDTVRRVFMETLPKYKSLKDADKAARDRLHQITGAFMTADEIGRAEKRIVESGADALEELWKLHSSTRERLDSWRELYTRVFSVTGTVRSANDLACGLNPLMLAAMDVPVIRGCDIQGGAARVVNGWAERAGRDIRIACADLLCGVPEEEAELTLMMKLLPVLDRQKAGTAARLLAECASAWILVTYPTRTLGGRNVGMEQQYREYMASVLPGDRDIAEEFVCGTELCFVLRRR